MEPAYLDYNATTPVDERVIEAMLPWFRTPSNAGSRTHSFGQSAKNAIDRAREQIAVVVGGAPEDIVFTSGATESNNLALLGLERYGKRSGRTHIISTSIEHKAVLEPLDRLSEEGFEIELVPVTSGGYVDPDEITKRLRPETLLVSVMHANNETGVLQPIEEIAQSLATTPVLFHTDAAQTFGKVRSLKDIPFDFASISGHKIYGPQGIGALCVRRKKIDRREIRSLTSGGGQERGLRPGTVPVALTVGLGMAAELALRECDARNEAAAAVKVEFLREFGGIEFNVNGDQDRTLPHVLNVCFPDIDSEALMMALRDIAAISNGSACTSNHYSPSHVLAAMGFDEERISSSVRLSWGFGMLQSSVERLVSGLQRLS